ncbi:hypothetical protein P5673_022356 [Acropora cervicornis]|uniref:Uncharacterized protein n=1 Tax=Acropora cervicornis TaxID=6130 RepID=A0AAD9Q6N6_ACRCE|nr:hypothetical protein P5673_022356 [Acropora cervicornis]
MYAFIFGLRTRDTNAHGLPSGGVKSYATGLIPTCITQFLQKYFTRRRGIKSDLNFPLAAKGTSSLREELNSESLSERIEGELEREDTFLFLCFPSSHFFCYITCCDYDVREKPAVVISRALQLSVKYLFENETKNWSLSRSSSRPSGGGLAGAGCDNITYKLFVDFELLVSSAFPSNAWHGLKFKTDFPCLDA